MICLSIIPFTSGCSILSSISDGIFKTESTKVQDTNENKDTVKSQEENQCQDKYQNNQDKNNDDSDNNEDLDNNDDLDREQDSGSSNEPEGSMLEIVEDPANKENDTEITSSQEAKNNTPSSPSVSLEIILGPEYVQDNQVCYWRIKAVVSGNPSPEIKFSKDDSNGSWGKNISQVNLSEGQSYTLVCDVKNSEGSASSSLTFNWVEIPADFESGQPQDQQSSQADIQVDYQDVANFKIDINLSTQRVTVYYKDNAIKSMVCSGGAPQSPTPLGNFTTYQKIYYAWVPRFNQGAYYWTRFYGPYLIHSVPFDKNGNIISEEYAKLGSPASHGCVRLEVEDAKWLYEVLPLGINVSIHN